jgi:hypothetical protein
MTDKPDEHTIAMIIVICEILGKQTNANTVTAKFEHAMKEMKEHRRAADKLRHGSYEG